MNRFFRRMQRFGKQWSRDRSKGMMRPTAPDQRHPAGTPQDVTDERAKNARHKKVTADKWNQ